MRRIFQFSLQWDSNYGIDCHRGWTVSINGITLVSFAKNPVVALWKAWRLWTRFRNDI